MINMTRPDTAQAGLPHFAKRLVGWQREHGRNHLPWSGGDDYSVWLSEVMLQQTQVATVLPYFAAFKVAYPTIHALAAASIDEVLARWAGLGYYSRARNLHRCAVIVAQQYQGVFPRELKELESLPGIGPSTAAAIASLAQNQSAAILDGNVKRVLARHAGIAGWAGDAAVAKQLWAVAKERLLADHVPADHHRRYTQGLMDLGATVCSAKSPQCERCPVAADCVALDTGSVAQIPAPRPKKTVPTQTRHALVVHTDTGVWLQRRAHEGLWGGLLSLLEADQYEGVVKLAHSLGTLLDCTELAAWHIPKLKHTFTHYHLDWRLWSLPIADTLPAPWVFVAWDQLAKVGVPKAVLKAMGQA